MSGERQRARREAGGSRRERPEGTRVRRQPLSTERIEVAALGLIERDGLADFSTRRLAAALGCKAMSIYHHYPSKAHLMNALLDRVLTESIRMPPPELPLGERLRAAAHALRAVALERPQFFQFLALHRMNTPTGLGFINRFIAIFRDAGFGVERTARLFRAFSYYVIGGALDESSGYDRGPSAVEPVPDEVLRRDFPEVAAVGPYFRAAERRATFDTGLDMLVEAIVAEAAALRQAKRPGSRSARRRSAARR